jgi:predicted DNA-binding transcriptional regulator YafY
VKRLDRLLAIALLLSARRRLQGQELAEHFDVSLRTVYRDVRSLVDAGFPITGTPGDGYLLPSTSTMRPLVMEPAEAEALVMGARLLEQAGDDAIRARLATAVAKLESVLPPDGVRRLREHRTRVRLSGGSRGFGPLGVLLEGVTEKRVVLTDYGLDHKRPIEPLGLVRIGESWYVPAYCRLREDLRTFRADRILAAELTDEKAPVRPGVSLDSFGGNRRVMDS